MSYSIQISIYYDGDSGKFANGERFRLSGVHAPEKNDPDYLKAKRSFIGMCSQDHGWVDVTEVARDSWCRVIVDLYNNWGWINERLRKKGYY